MSKKNAVWVSLSLSFLAALLLAAGCGNGAVKDPAGHLEEAARKAREEGSVHAQVNATLSPQEGESGLALNVQGDAWMDMEAGVAEARFTVMGMELSLRYVNGTAYLQMGGSWYEIKGEIISGIGEGAVGAAVDVITSFPQIFSSAAEVEQVGEEEIGGRACVVLRVVPDLAAISELEAVRKLADELEMTPEEVEEYLADAEPTMEVSVQKDDPVIRRMFITAKIDLSELGSVGGLITLPEKARLELWMEMPEYGMPVEVQAPAEARPFEGL